MSKTTAGEIRRSDYSLVGKDTALAIEKGLADAKWYASPVPRDKMRELLERRDGPAIRDTLLWFALLFVFGLSVNSRTLPHANVPAMCGQYVPKKQAHSLRNVKVGLERLLRLGPNGDRRLLV